MRNVIAAVGTHVRNLMYLAVLPTPKAAAHVASRLLASVLRWLPELR